MIRFHKNIIFDCDLERKSMFQYFVKIFQDAWKFQMWNILKWKSRVKYSILNNPTPILSMFVERADSFSRNFFILKILLFRYGSVSMNVDGIYVFFLLHRKFPNRGSHTRQRSSNLRFGLENRPFSSGENKNPFPKNNCAEPFRSNYKTDTHTRLTTAYYRIVRVAPYLRTGARKLRPRDKRKTFPRERIILRRRRTVPGTYPRDIMPGGSPVMYSGFNPRRAAIGCGRDGRGVGVGAIGIAVTGRALRKALDVSFRLIPRPPLSRCTTLNAVLAA